MVETGQYSEIGMGNLREEKNKTSMKHGCLLNPIKETFFSNKEY